jgi:3-methyladenine DNA glycosylase AlkD
MPSPCTAKALRRALSRNASPARARINAWFFKTGPGEYGEGDRFLGLRVPDLRGTAKDFKDIPLSELSRTLKSPWHEERLTALLILVLKWGKAGDAGRKRLEDFYLLHRPWVNNWDLVDSSAPQVLGARLEKDPGLLKRLLKSQTLWDRRIAIVGTQHGIRRGRTDLAFRTASKLLGDPEDLMHKAVGWTLREAGKKDRAGLLRFLDRHAAAMPRTALRYALERQKTRIKAHYMNLKSPRKRAFVRP